MSNLGREVKGKTFQGWLSVLLMTYSRIMRLGFEQKIILPSHYPCPSTIGDKIVDTFTFLTPISSL